MHAEEDSRKAQKVIDKAECGAEQCGTEIQKPDGSLREVHIQRKRAARKPLWDFSAGSLEE